MYERVPHTHTPRHCSSILQVVGGVSTPGAWSQLERSHGCVYHGEAAYQEGAVGAILHGRVALDTLVTPGFRPAGPAMVGGGWVHKAMHV
jgi:hypothetical protein